MGLNERQSPAVSSAQKIPMSDTQSGGYASGHRQGPLARCEPEPLSAGAQLGMSNPATVTFAG
jgi:hypothetical protein